MYHDRHNLSRRDDVRRRDPLALSNAAGRGFYVWGGYANLGNYPPFLKKHRLYFSQGIVWDKQHPVLTRKDRMGRRVERLGFAWRRSAVFSCDGAGCDE